MLTVRRTTPDALPQWQEISAASLAGEDVLVRIGRTGFTLGYVPLARAEWRTYPPANEALESLALPRTTLLAAYDGDMLAGCALTHENSNGWTEILDIRVDAAHRRKGVARALLASAEDTSLRHGMTGLKMCVTDTNPVICQFCEHCGFTLQGMDRMALLYTPQERDKPLARRASLLIFYRLHQKG